MKHEIKATTVSSQSWDVNGKDITPKCNCRANPNVRLCTNCGKGFEEKNEALPTTDE